MQETQLKAVDEFISNFKYIAYGFGIALGLIVFICGFLFKFIASKFHQFATDRNDIAELKQSLAITKNDVEALKDHETGKSSFSRGLYAITEKMAVFKSEQDNMKAQQKEMFDRCERRHVPPAYDYIEKRVDQRTFEGDDKRKS